MRRRGVGLGRRAEADDGPAGDQRGPVVGLRLADGVGDRVGVVAVDALGVPAAGVEALELVLMARQLGRAVDRDVIVVPEDDQLAELQMAGERDRFLADAFHEAAIAAEHISVMIDEVFAEARCLQPFGERHADGIAEPLAERPGRHFDAVGVATLGMAGATAAELAEILDLAHRHVGIAGQMQQRIEQHRAVAVREDEAVAVGPMRRGGIEFEELAPQHRGDVGHAHRHAGMTAVRRLDRIHRQRADRVCHATQMLVARRGKGGCCAGGGFGGAHRQS